MRRPLLAAALLLPAFAVWGAIGPLPVPLSPVVWLGALWLPGVALARGSSLPGGTKLDELWIPLGLGPILFGVGWIAARMVGIPVAGASLVPILAGGATLAWVELRDARGSRAAVEGQTAADGAAAPVPAGHASEETPHGPVSRRWIFPLVAGGIVLLLGVLPPLAHQPLRMRDDARLHLPIIQEVLAGSFPPGNPFLAGEPLAYFWFYHVVLAGVTRLTGLPLDLVPALFNLQALLVFLLALDRAGRRFGLTPIARGSALLFFGLGLTPWGWMRLAYLQQFHPELNWALFRANGVGALLPLLSPGEPRLAASLTKVAMTNALPMSLAIAVLALTPPTVPRPAAWIRRAVYVAGGLGFHLATGILLAAGLTASWVASRWMAPRTRTASPTRSFGFLAAIVAGSLIAVPYLLAVQGAREGTTATFGFHAGKALRLNLALVALWLASAPVLAVWLRRGDTLAWLAAGLPSLLLPFAAHLVDGNEYKSIFMLLVLLSLPAGAGLARLVHERAWAAAVLFLLFFPTAALAARAYARDVGPGTLARGDEAETRRVGAQLPRGAVIWRPDLEPYYSPFTVALGRTSYLSDVYALQILGQWNGEEARWRRGSLELTGSPGRVTEALSAARSRVGTHPLYALVTREADRSRPFLRAEIERLKLRKVAVTPLFHLYEVPAP